LNLCRN